MKKNKIILSLDIDWAPDFILYSVAEKLISQNIKSTWFVTHKTPFIDFLRKRSDLFELGIHPNFLPKSSQGSTPQEVLEYCMNIIPEATSIRSHSLFQSTHIANLIKKETPIKIDTSLFLYEMPYIRPFPLHTPHGILKRLPFIWMDDHELLQPEILWRLDRFIKITGTQVFLFHPIHIYLNTPSIEHYKNMKLSTPHLPNVHQKDLDCFIYLGNGVANLLDSFIKDVYSLGEGAFIKDFA